MEYLPCCSDRAQVHGMMFERQPKQRIQGLTLQNKLGSNLSRHIKCFEKKKKKTLRF